MKSLLVTIVLAALLVVGCGSTATPSGGVPSGSAPATNGGPLTHLTVGLGYVPSVQFAQFYRAQVQGYYRDAGLDVTFENGNDANLIPLIAQGTYDIGLADGTSVIPAVGQNIPIVYVATMFAQFPNVVIAPADSGISKPADLQGKTIGTPGAYGSSWVMLQALLSAANLTTSDIVERDYPDFGQGIALQQGQVQAATAYRNNEPIQLGLAGFSTTQLTVDDIVPLPGPGLIVSTATLAAKKDALKAFVAATLRAMKEIDANPQLGVDDSVDFLESASIADSGTQLAILQATIKMWHSALIDSDGFGTIDEGGWNASLSFMEDLPGANIPDTVNLDSLINTELLP